MITLFWDHTYNRGLDTLAIWSHHAPTFQLGPTTLAMHIADVNRMSIQLQTAEEHMQVLDTARSARNDAARTLRQLFTRACKLIVGTLPDGHPATGKVDEVRSVRDRSLSALERKGRKLVPVWKEINTVRAGMNPPLAPLLVGTTSVQDLENLLGNYAQLLANVANKESPANTERRNLNLLCGDVYVNNKRWYEAWQGQFPPDSVQRAALSQIDTGSSQSLPGQGVFLEVATLPNHVVKLNFGAARAKSFTLLHKGPGETAFTVLADELTTRTFQHTASPGEHSYKVIGHNTPGAGPESAPAVVTVAQQVAA